jgi:hypothetical protein
MNNNNNNNDDDDIKTPDIDMDFVFQVNIKRNYFFGWKVS